MFVSKQISFPGVQGVSLSLKFLQKQLNVYYKNQFFLGHALPVKIKKHKCMIHPENLFRVFYNFILNWFYSTQVSINSFQVIICHT